MRGENKSGWNENQIIEEAHTRFSTRREALNNNSKGDKKLNESFQFVHAWTVLRSSSVFIRDCDTFSLSSARKRQRIPERSSDCQSIPENAAESGTISANSLPCTFLID